MTDVSKYRLNHTMYRVRDGPASVDFYTRVLGMKLIQDSHFPEAKFSLYFLGYEATSGVGVAKSQREGLIELTHNHGTESDPNFAGYNTGNGETGGYGHIAIIVDDLTASVARLDSLGVKFLKRPEEGRMRNIAFIYDPDGYRVELIGQ
ncbi:hypothetical protein BB561_005928 [Smittium simulii]|uniref:lactoylglutathione lyase n=1 Tax=Smittium simulii TaxID=133385 RepID=A0A2T9Y7I2_9FUNG|nr:hypothetical protein BB561_005928 [Smittium simulii]